MKEIKHIFFNLDHTIWDFEKNSSDALSEIFDEFDLAAQIDSKERFLKTYQHVNAVYWKKYRDGIIDKETVRNKRFEATLDRFKIQNSWELGLKISDEYIRRSPQKTALFPHSHQTLQYLKERYPLHIITNGFREVVGIKLSHAKLDPYFDVVVSSEDIGRNKPHPSVFKFALEKAGATAEESLMVGDNLEADISGAKKVGMKTLWFNPKNEVTKVKTEQITCLSDLQKIL